MSMRRHAPGLLLGVHASLQEQRPQATTTAACVAAVAAERGGGGGGGGGEYRILEGRSFALLLPLVMGGIFTYTFWAGYLS
jgi:hypothetical protein